MTNRLSKTLRITLVSVASFLAGCLSLLLFLQYEIHRASRLFDDLHDVRIGDSEESIKPLVARYSGFLWHEQLGAHADYAYAVVVNPWCFPLIDQDKVCEKIHAAELATRTKVRIATGLRTWMATGEIAIKNGRVVAVQSETIVEGQRMWLGAFWRLSDKPREFEPNPNALDKEPRVEHFASSGAMTMASGSGTSWEFWTTSSSPEVQNRIVRGVNFECLRPFSACETPCDLMPAAAREFKSHPELALWIGGWDPNLGTCAKYQNSDQKSQSPENYSGLIRDNEATLVYPTLAPAFLCVSVPLW